MRVFYFIICGVLVTCVPVVLELFDEHNCLASTNSILLPCEGEAKPRAVPHTFLGRAPGSPIFFFAKGEAKPRAVPHTFLGRAPGSPIVFAKGEAKVAAVPPWCDRLADRMSRQG